MEPLTRKRKYLLLGAWTTMMLILAFTVEDKFLFVVTLFGAALFPYDVFGTEKSPSKEELEKNDLDHTDPH